MLIVIGKNVSIQFIKIEKITKAGLYFMRGKTFCPER